MQLRAISDQADGYPNTCLPCNKNFGPPIFVPHGPNIFGPLGTNMLEICGHPLKYFIPPQN